MRQSPTKISADTAAAIAGGELIGWFQGRAELGARALGGRSIVADPRRADMREVLNELADSHSLFELQPDYGRNIITALARIGGDPCMLIANQPSVQAGAITTEAAEKATHFINVANDFGLPLVNLLDNPGVMPGPAAEKSGVLKAAGHMFQAQRRYR